MKDFIDMIKEIIEAIKDILEFYSVRRKYNPPPVVEPEEITVPITEVD